MRWWFAAALVGVVALGMAVLARAKEREKVSRPAPVPQWVYDEDEEPWKVLPLPA